jgi:hypothetical protein
MIRSLLAVYAHPDDEAFSIGGAVPCYTAQGVNVILLCATRGEVGEISDPALAKARTLVSWPKVPSGQGFSRSAPIPLWVIPLAEPLPSVSSM